MKLEDVIARILLVSWLVVSVLGAPVIHNEIDDTKEKEKAGQTAEERDLGLSYERYLKQIIEFLEEDEQFREKLGTAKMEDITSGKIANELQFVDHRIRSRLDELKRRELHRLRQASKQENELAHGIDRRRLGMPLHVDARNPHTFEIEDLKKLVQQTTKDLEEIDRRRREDFKHYEMEKEHKRRDDLQKMDEDHRRTAEKEHEDQEKRHREHPRLHHPGSKQQLEEVWEKEDQLPTEEFNPLTFFQMHDLDGDGHWDEEEVKSLFRQELNKMYDQNNTDDDMQERREEMDRMREHVVNETDINDDGLISLQEFMEMTKRNEFNQDPGWEGLDEQQLYDETEFREFERQYQAGMIPPGAVYVPGGVQQGAQYQYGVDNGQPHVGQPMYPSHQGYGQGPPTPGQYQYQQQGSQYQGGVPPAQYPGGAQQAQYPGGAQQAQYPGGAPQAQYQGRAPQAQYQGGAPQAQYQGGAPQAQYQGGAPQAQYQPPVQHDGHPQQGPQGGQPQFQASPPGMQQQQQQYQGVPPPGAQHQAAPAGPAASVTQPHPNAVPPPKQPPPSPQQSETPKPQ